MCKPANYLISSINEINQELNEYRVEANEKKIAELQADPETSTLINKLVKENESMIL
jgi:hypothetical protein